VKAVKHLAALSLVVGLAALACLAGGCARKTDASRVNFESGMRAYLERRGDLCLAKDTWPIDVTAQDIKARSRDAVQMPVFERLGLVRSSDVVFDVNADDAPHAVEVKRYELTEAGRRDFREHEIGVNPAGQKITAGDFCVARLSLAKVVGWELSTGPAPDTASHAVVSYTYEVEADPWTKDPEAQKVLPAVARVVNGAESVELTESFTLTPDGWVADQLLPGDVRMTSNPPRPAAPGNP
jgi:hypothetical protein